MKKYSGLLLFLPLFAFGLSTVTSCGTSHEKSKTAGSHFRLGASLIQKQQLEKGLNHLLISKKLDPSNPNTHNQVGVAYYLMGEYEHAILSFRDAISRKESYSEARNNLGRVLIDVKDFSGARIQLQKAASDLTYPHKDKVWLNFGLSYFFEFQYKKSLNFFLKSIATNRRNCLAHAYYGRALVELEDFSKSAPALDKAIYQCRNRGFDEPHYYSAISLFRLGKKNLAISRLQEALKLYPKGPYRAKNLEMLELLNITDTK